MDKILLVKQYTDGEFRALLSKFQDAIDKHEYTEKIPYDTWRKLMKTVSTIHIEIVNGILNIYKWPDSTVLYSAKTHDWGFGRFFYDYVVKKENERMTLNSATSAVSACDVVDATKVSALESKADYIAADVAYATSLTDKHAYDSSGYTYHGTYTNSDSTNGAKIAGKPLNSNNIELNTSSLGHFDYHQINGTWDFVAFRNEANERFDKLETELQKKEDKAEKNECVKENDTMMKGINFDFGPCGNTVRLSMYGMAIQNISGEWVSYNPDSREIINVDVFNMADSGKYMYKIPVAIADVKEGDIVIHSRVPMFVTAVNENGTFEVIDVRAGETKNIIPTRSPFGFNFMTKVVSLFGAFTDVPTADQPFGNILPFLMMGEDKDIDPMMMFFMMGQSNTNIMANPMMMYFMMKDNKDFDPMLMFMMMNQTQPHTCNCAKHVEKPVVQA